MKEIITFFVAIIPDTSRVGAARLTVVIIHTSKRRLWKDCKTGRFICRFLRVEYNMSITVSTLTVAEQYQWYIAFALNSLSSTMSVDE
jgi:hypothetical protein